MDPESWSEKAKVSICVEGATDVQFESLTETIDIDLGDKDIEAIANVKGGRIIKFIPQEMTTITLEAYPLEAGTDTGSIGKGFFDLLNTQDTTQPLSISVDHARNRYRVAILWTNDTTNTAAHLAVTGGSLGLRVVACGFFTSAKPSFTDGVLKWTVQMKAPPFKKDGTANVNIGSCNTATALAALSAFTTTENGF